MNDGITIQLDGNLLANFNPYMLGNFEFIKDNLPHKYIINEHVCVCFWEFGAKTISKRHKEDKFDKELGFLLACYQYYKRDWSKNKRKKSLERIKPEYIKEYLLEIFAEKNDMTIKQAKSYLKNLKMEGEK